MDCIDLLDHGFIRMVDFMGGDQAIVNAARCSYGAGTKTVNEDKGLINYLIRNQHWTPVEMTEITWHVKMPIFVMAQWIRHRTANVNSLSYRYSEATDQFYVPTPHEIRGQSTTNKQVGEGQLDADSAFKASVITDQQSRQAFTAYQELLALGVAREQARMILPQNIYTEIYWKCDLRNTFNFLQLRMDPHAQQEIRVYAEAMYQLLQPKVPMAVEAWENHIKNAVRFSADEMGIIREWVARAGDCTSLTNEAELVIPKRRAIEFMNKLEGESND